MILVRCSGLFWLLLLILPSCSHPGKLVSDEVGIHRNRSKWHFTGAPDFVFYGVRDEQNKLITDHEEAKTAFEASNGEVVPPSSEIRCQALTFSQNSYLASVHYYEALEFIRKKKWEQALVKLADAKSYCDGLQYQSSYYYLVAFIQWKLGEADLAKQAARDFLKYSERPEPYSFSQSDTKSPESEQFFNYTKKLVTTLRHNREKASSFIKNGSPLALSTYEAKAKEPRMPHNNFWVRPGFTSNKLSFPTPYFNYNHNYSDYPGTELGIAYGFPLWGVYFIPRLSYKNDFDWNYGLNVRAPFYQSFERDLNLEVTGFYRSAVRGDIRRLDDGSVMGISNKESGRDFGVGLGGTKRFLGRYSISSEINYVELFIRDQGKFLGTLYGSINLNTEWAIYTGVLNDNYQAGFEWMLWRIGYDFRYQGISVRWFNFLY